MIVSQIVNPLLNENKEDTNVKIRVHHASKITGQCVILENVF